MNRIKCRGEELRQCGLIAFNCSDICFVLIGRYKSCPDFEDAFIVNPLYVL